MAKLAINGGDKAVPDGTIKPWPPVDKTDEKLVLDALHSDKQARGDHNIALEKEFAEWNGNTYNGLPVASGIYIYVVEAEGYGQKIGKFAIFKEVEVLKKF